MWRVVVLLAGLTACATAPEYHGQAGCEQLARDAGFELSNSVDSYPIAHTNVRILTWLPVGEHPIAECTLREGRIERMRVGLTELAPTRR